MKISKAELRPSVVATLAVAAVLFALILSYTSTFETLELKLIDWRFSLRGPLPGQDTSIVIITIDDQSDESTTHPWPWPRYYYAHLIRNLQKAGAAVIGIDVIFDSDDAFNPASDDSLARVLAQSDNVVLAGKLLVSKTQNYISPVRPVKKFIENGTPWGIVAVESDVDGFYRRYQLTRDTEDTTYTSFAGHVLSQYLKADSVTSDNRQYFLGRYRIPKFDSNSMLVNFRGPAFSYPHYSFDNVVDDAAFDLREDYDVDAFDDAGDAEQAIPPGLLYSGELKGKVVLVGATMDELHDNFPTPFLDFTNNDNQQVRAEMPGVEIHANAISTILNRRFIRLLPWYLELFILALTALMTFIYTRYFSGALSAVFTFLNFVFGVAFAAYMFISFNLVIKIVSPMFTLGLSYSAYMVYHYLLAQQEKRMLRGAFAHYVPEKVVQELVANPEKLQLGGEERVVTVLFSDVAGFTSISEQLTPHELVVLLNEYLTAMTDIVLKHGGIIDKYEGDAIMAEFGVPVSFPDHARAACQTALDMQQTLKVLRKKWKEEGRPELEARVGINTGNVIVGNMGSRDVFDYTVMGDNVNLGSRLEGANKAYGTKIMISEFTLEHVRDTFYTRPLDLIRVKGKTKPIEVFELLAARETNFADRFLELIDVYSHGIKAYRSQSWDKAIELFEHCLQLFPNDYPSKLYHERCLNYKFNPPGNDWDGVTTMTTK